MGPACQGDLEAQKTVLVYTSPPLEDAVELVGDVTLTLFAATSAVDTDFTARLCVVDETGRSTNLQEGILRARYRDSLSEPSLLEPGRVYELLVELGPVAARLEAGQRIRVDVSSSDFPQWDRNLNTGGKLGSEGPSAAITATQLVLHDAEHPSRISLPVLSQR
jgi:putative CocE/NonD family hydrolase